MNGHTFSKALWFYCPGCRDLHSVTVWRETGGRGPVWDWNNDLVSVTIDPSILVTWADHCCHSFVRNGRWQFLGDCTHDMKGMTVDMQPIPEGWL